MANKQQITYQPDFEYKKNYNTIGTIGTISDTIDDTSYDNEGLIDLFTLDSLKAKIQNVKPLLINIPTEISSICFDILKGIDNTLPYIKDPVFDSSDSSNNNSDNSNKNNSISADPRSNLSNGKIINLPSSSSFSGATYTAKKKKNTVQKNLVDAFDYTVLTIYNDFIDAISEKIGAYQSNLALGNTFGLQIDMSQQYSENTNNIANGLEHISDNIIRSQIIYDQKSSLLSKLFDFQNCITHFRSLYSAKEFYIRYRSEKAYKNNASSKDKFIYDTLQATIIAYYNKYCNCVSNIYKYYDSCSELIGECLNMQSQIFVSRKILNK